MLGDLECELVTAVKHISLQFEKYPGTLNLPIVCCQSIENSRELVVLELDCGAKSAPVPESR
jgi:hypothetical protein